MAARLKFAHLTDIHLPIPGRPAPHDLMNKRVLGYLSWTRKRRHWHKMEVSDALVADMRRQGCDAAFLTGDVINIALKAEFDAARSWLDRSFPGLPLVLSPGNHDAYVRTPWESSLGTFGKYMIGSRADDPVPTGCKREVLQKRKTTPTTPLFVPSRATWPGAELAR